MAKLVYSSSGLNALKKLHKKEYVIYVEGPDDLRFWNSVLKASGVSDYILKEAGGCDQLNEIMNSIVNHNSDVYVARDKDYSHLLGGIPESQRILLTFGHSIENSYFIGEIISPLIENWIGIANTNSSSEFNKWLEERHKQIKELLILEVSNHRTSRGVRVLGDSAALFLKNNSTDEFCPLKIEAQVQSIRKKFSASEFEEANIAIERYGLPRTLLIRGHFLCLAVINFVKKSIHIKTQKKPAISTDVFYAMCNQFFSNHLTSDHSQSEYYRELAKRFPTG